MAFSDLRAVERRELEHALSATVSGPLAGGSPAQPDDDTAWRVLIMDGAGRDLIAPFFKVNALREHNITLHLSLEAARDAIPTVSAIYLCEPTLVNVTRIAEDCVNLLYESFTVNFTRSATRKLLESFAEKLRPLPSIDHVRVVDRPFAFIAQSSNLVTLREPAALGVLHSRSTSDADMEAYMDRLAASIADVGRCLKQVPYVAYLKNGPVPDIAQRAVTRISDGLRDDLTGQASATAAFGAQRPLVLLVDRTIDLLTPLHHPFTYGGLLIDEMGSRLGKVDVPTADIAATGDKSAASTSAPSGGAASMRGFEVDPEEDVFLRAHAITDFGDMGEHIEREVTEYKREYAALSASALADDADSTGAADNNGKAPADSGKVAAKDDAGAAVVARMLANAPKLAERKRRVDTHNILTRVILKRVTDKGLDAFHGVESAILRRGEIDKVKFFELLRNKNVPLSDRQRLAAIALVVMCNGSHADTDAELEKEVAEALTEAPPAAAAATTSGGNAATVGASRSDAKPSASSSSGLPSCISFIRENRSPLSLALSGHSTAASSANSSAAATGWRFAESLARGIAKAVGRDTGDRLPVTKLVEALLQSGSRPPVARTTGGTAGNASGGTGGGPAAPGSLTAQIFSNFVATDPRTRANVDLGALRFAQVIVVMVGGGTVVEHEELLLLERSFNTANTAAQPAGGGSGHNSGLMQPPSPTSVGGPGVASVVYCVTELLGGNEMILQLNALGAT